MEYQDTEQKRKIRIVTIATIIAVVVLGLGVWLVVAAISSTKKSNTEVATTTESSKTESKKAEETKKTEQQGNPNASSPANQYGAKEKTTTATTTNTATVKAPAKSEVPNTGPAEDMMIVALLAGVATYLIGLNLNLKKQAAERNA